jgi:hypothetical protein
MPTSDEKPVIAVGLIDGDEDGSMTQATVQALSASGRFKVVPRDGTYRLELKIIHSESESIGYRRDRQQIKGKTKKNLLAAEARKTIGVEVQLIRANISEDPVEPVVVKAWSDYDYIDGDSVQDLMFTNSVGVTTTVLPFSLGQLEPYDAAQEATLKPLYASLAQKIVDAIEDLISE